MKLTPLILSTSFAVCAANSDLYCDSGFKYELVGDCSQEQHDAAENIPVDYPNSATGRRMAMPWKANQACLGVSYDLDLLNVAEGDAKSCVTIVYRGSEYGDSGNNNYLYPNDPNRDGGYSCEMHASFSFCENMPCETKTGNKWWEMMETDEFCEEILTDKDPNDDTKVNIPSSRPPLLTHVTNPPLLTRRPSFALAHHYSGSLTLCLLHAPVAAVRPSL